MNLISCDINCPGSELKREEIEQLILDLLLGRFLVIRCSFITESYKNFLLLELAVHIVDKARQTSLHLRVKMEEQTLFSINIYDDSD